MPITHSTPRPWRRIPIDVEDLKTRHLAGESVKQASVRLGISRAVLTERLIRAGVQPRNRSQSMFNRMAHSTALDRKIWSASAHDAVRGRKKSYEQKCNMAQGKQKIPKIGHYERHMMGALAVRGVGIITPQLAVEIYNIDLAIHESRLAVEVFGGMWHGGGHHKESFKRRYRCLMKNGWMPVFVWVSKRTPLKPAAIEYVCGLHRHILAGERISEPHAISGDGVGGPLSANNAENGYVVRCKSRCGDAWRKARGHN